MERGGLWAGSGVGRAQQLGLEGELEKRPRLLKVICHWARKTNSDQVLPRTRGPSLRSCSLLLPIEESSFGLHRNLGGPIPPPLGKLSWLPGRTVSLFLGKFEQAKRVAPLFTAASLHHPVFTRNPQQTKTGRLRTSLTSSGLPVRAPKAPPPFRIHPVRLPAVREEGASRRSLL